MGRKKSGKLKQPAKTRNEKLAEGLRQLAHSSAAGTHDPRPRKQRTRADSKRSAIAYDRGAFSLSGAVSLSPQLHRLALTTSNIP